MSVEASAPSAGSAGEPGDPASAGGGCNEGRRCRRPSSPSLPLVSALDAPCALAAGLSLLLAALVARVHPLLAVWSVAEGCFYLWQRYRYQLIHSEPVTDAAIEDERMEMLKERLLSLSDVVSLDDFLTGWFRGAPRSKILRGNVEDFISYGFHCSTLEDLERIDPEKRRGVSSFVDDIERRYDTSFAPGRNEGIHFMAHLWEPLRTIHSPLSLRLGLETMRLATVLLLKVAGFRRGRVDVVAGARGGRGSGYDYWVLPPAVADGGREGERDEEAAATAAADGDGASRPLRRRRSERRRRSGNPGEDDDAPLVSSVADSASSLEGEDFGADDGDESGGDERISRSTPVDPSTAPLVFLHGVGLGITPYLFFVYQLRKRFPRRPLVLLEARHVSIGLVPTRAASTCDVAAAVLSCLDREGGGRWRSAAVVAHSYGTFVAARLLALRPTSVQSLVLLDPVCALTIYPQLLANFVYKPPVALCSGEERARERERQAESGYFWPKQEEDGEKREPATTPSPSSALAAAAAAASSAAATARALLTAVDSARFLFSRDLTVGEAFCRRFAWHRECLWPQDLRHGGRSTLFGLAGGDDLVPGRLVRKALSLSGSRALVAGNFDDGRAGHGGFLLDLDWQRRLLDGAEVVVGAGAEEEARESREEERRSTTAATKLAFATEGDVVDDADGAPFERSASARKLLGSEVAPSFAPVSPPRNGEAKKTKTTRRRTSDGKASAAVSYSRRAVVPLSDERGC